MKLTKKKKWIRVKFRNLLQDEDDEEDAPAVNWRGR